MLIRLGFSKYPRFMYNGTYLLIRKGKTITYTYGLLNWLKLYVFNKKEV
jgi:hypothetical protein